jgi:hypothetical protein
MNTIDPDTLDLIDKLTLDSPSPLPAGPDGKYPVPMPGLVKDREYA